MFLKPLTTKKNIFLERWSRAEYLNEKLGHLCLALLGILLLTVFMGTYFILKPKPIYYVTPQGQAGLASVLSSPMQVAGVFAQSWVLNWENVNPTNIKNVYEENQKWMSPSFLAKFKLTLKEEMETALRDNLSSQFSLDSKPQVIKDGEAIQVIIIGTKRVFMSDQSLSQQRVRLTISLTMVSPTQINPYGLVIHDLDQDILS